MDGCEVCGRKSDQLFQVSIEGAEMIVCASCGRGKKVTAEFSNREEQKPKIISKKQKEELQIVDNFGSLIKHSRESLGLSHKVLAERINERESTIIRVEKGEHLPDDRLARKLEKELGIRLLVQEAPEGKRFSSSKPDSVTFGDSVVIKGKGKKDKGN